MPEGYLHLTCEQRCQITRSCKAPLASPHRAANWRRSVDDQPRACSQHRRARLSLQASAREGLAETPRGLGQAAQNDARFGGADRRKTDARAVSPDQISGRLAKDGVAFISHERIYQHVWKDKKDGARCIFICVTAAKNTTGASARIGRGLRTASISISGLLCRRKKPHRTEADTYRRQSQRRVSRTSSEPPNTPSSPNCRQTGLVVQASTLSAARYQIETITTTMKKVRLSAQSQPPHYPIQPFTHRPQHTLPSPTPTTLTTTTTLTPPNLTPPPPNPCTTNLCNYAALICAVYPYDEVDKQKRYFVMNYVFVAYSYSA